MNSRTSRRTAALLQAAAVVVLLAGCAGSPGGGPGQSANPPTPTPSGTGGSGTNGGSNDITGTWAFVNGTDPKGEFTPGTTKVTFTINGASSGGHGPCNSFGATTRGSTTGAIRIVVGVHTNMACLDPERNATESRYFAALDAVTSASIDNGRLTLSGGGDTLVFTRGSP